jgi:acetoin utilization deacetylase AcuC-like enzyme
MGDAEYISVFRELLTPITQEFEPDLILISAGFDCGEGDTIGDMCVTPNGFAELARIVKKLLGGKVVMCLEGGYQDKVTARGVESCVRVLLEGGGQESEEGGTGGQREGEEGGFNQGSTGQHCKDVIERVKEMHKKYWEVFDRI